MPINNPYTQRLERERSDILRRKRNIESFLKAPWSISDSVDRNNAIRDAQSHLRYLQREYEKVCHELGRVEQGELKMFSVASVQGSSTVAGSVLGTKFYRSWQLAEVSLCRRGANPDCRAEIFSSRRRIP
jgi:hypothetical protein